MKFILLLLSISIWADTLIVDVYPFPPCVVIENGKVSGFDIELFEKIAVEQKLNYKYNIVTDFRQLLADLVCEKSDIAIAGITINSKRESYIDFSHPYLNSGLSILIRNENNNSVLGIISTYLAKTWQALLIFFIFLLICSILMWLFERGKDSFNDKFIQGVCDGIYWTNTTMTTVGYGDKTPQTAKGKFLAVVVMWIGIVIIFPYVVAQMGQIVDEEQYLIQKKEDLKDKRVAIVLGTTSEDAVNNLKANVYKFKTPKECIEKLKEGEVDAFVCDMPVIKNYANKDLIVIGQMFDKQDYGFALKQNSPLRELMNNSLLKILRNEVQYKKIYDRWFK